MANGERPRILASSIVTVAACAVVLAIQLFWPPRVGLANNGDFGKVTGIFALHAPGEELYRFADLRYDFDQRYRWSSGHYSSETLLAALGIGLNTAFGPRRVFDIRWMGAVHGLLFLLAVFLIQPLLADMAPVRRWIFSMAVVFVFCDFMYTSYFNSFYMDAATYVFLLLATAFFLRAARWGRPGDAAMFAASCVLLVLSKPQHAPLGVWLVALVLLTGGRLRPGRSRMVSLAAAVLAAATGFGLVAAPRDYAAKGYYTVLFSELLPHSPNQERTLRDLGLDASFKRWIGTHAYSADGGMSSPVFVAGFVKKASYARLGAYFLTHPREALWAVRVSLAEAGRERPLMGNFDRASGLPPFSESHAFSLWSDAKRGLLEGQGSRYLAVHLAAAFLLCAGAFARRRTMPRAFCAAAYALAGMAITSMLVASLADAVDVTRHHMIASALLDLEVMAGLALLMFAKYRGFRAANP